MKFITLTYGKASHFINPDKIHVITRHLDITWINLGNNEDEFKVDQTPEEIIKLIEGGIKYIGYPGTTI